MKKKIWKIVFALLGVFVFIWLIFPGLITNGSAGDVTQLGEINEMAQHLNDKYGYDVRFFDCTFFMKENYERDDNFFGFGGSRYDVPYVAAFHVNGREVIVTDRDGFISDNGQLDQISALITEFYIEQTGLTSLEFVEFSLAERTSPGDTMISDTLQRHYNALITSENIDEFLRVMLKNSGGAAMIFYFREEGDRQQQIEEISERIDKIAKPHSVKKLSFYTFADDDSLDIQSIRVNLRTIDDSEPYKFTFGCDYLINPHETKTKDKYTTTTFGYRGVYLLNRGYNGGFGKYEDQTFEMNGSKIVDLLHEIP